VKLRYKLLTTAIILGGVFLWGRCGKKPWDVAPTPNVLPPSESERITIDPGTHRITIQTPNGTKTETLPDRPTTFDVNKNGTVKITSRQFGFEHHLIIGYQVSDIGRIAVGMNGWYFKRLDIGGGIADQIGNHTPIVFVELSYNVWRSVETGLSYDNLGHPGFLLLVRI